MTNNEILDDKRGTIEGAVCDINSEAAMDKYLKSIGFHRNPVAKDGSCLFRAVAEKVYNTQAKHIDVRNECIRFMRDNSECFKEFVPGSFEHHLFYLQNPKEWAGQVEITALSMLYKHDIIVYQEVNQPPQNVTDNGFKEKILLCFSNGNHYDSIYPMSFKDDAAIVQSLLYDHLYKSVFPELERKDQPVVGSSYADVGATIDGNGWTDVATKPEKEEKPSSSKFSSHSWQIQRSLDPNVYRNVPLEVWEHSKEDQTKSDRKFAANLQFSIGEQCLLRFPGGKSDGDYVKARIDGFTKDNGFYTVFVHDYQEQYSVPVESLRPLLNDPQKGLQMDYTELPGYYKKSEDFQYPKTKKQKGKTNANNRDEDTKWKRVDIRYDSKADGKHEGRPENRAEAQGHRRENKRDKRGGAGGERVKGDKSEKKGKPNEKSFKKDSQRVVSPLAAQPKNDSKSLSEKRQEKSTNEQEIAEHMGVSTNFDYPSLQAQDKEKTAKRDESPAAFWERMRKDNKPVLLDNSKLKRGTELKPAIEMGDLEGATENVKPLHTVDDIKKSNLNEDSSNVEVELKDAVRKPAKETDELPTDAETANTFNEIRDQNASTTPNTNISNNVSEEAGVSFGSTLIQPENNANRMPLYSAPASNETKSHKSISMELNINANDNLHENIDAPVASKSTNNINARSMPVNENGNDSVGLDHHMAEERMPDKLINQPKKLSTSHTDQAVKNRCEISSPAFVTAAGTNPCSAENAVSFPTGFDEPVPASMGHYAAADDIVSSSSPLTFMSSQSEIPVNSNEKVGNDTNARPDCGNGTSFVSEVITGPDPAEQADIIDTKTEQKGEQKIRILRKDNKDQFVYFTPSNENCLSLETPGSQSIDRSPEQDAKKTQVKKVSFGNVTEISQAPLVAEASTADTPQPPTSDYVQSPYGNANGISEPQSQHYFSDSSTFDTPMGIPPHMMPVMMYPLPQPTEQIHVPPAYSMDPEGKDLPAHIPTVQYFFNLGLQNFFMQQAPHAFYNMSMHQIPPAPLPMQPQPMQSQATPQIPQQQFPLDTSTQQFAQERHDDFIAVSSAPATFPFEIIHQQPLNQVRQPHSNQNNSSQYEQPPRMRRGRGRVSNLGLPVSVSRGYNTYNQSQQRQQQFRLSRRNFPMNTGPQNQPFMYQ